MHKVDIERVVQHELVNVDQSLELALNSFYDGEPEEIDDSWRAISYKCKGDEVKEFVEALRDFEDEVVHNRNSENDSVARIEEYGSKLEDEFSDVLNHRIEEIRFLAPAILDYVGFENSGNKTDALEGISVDEAVDTFERYSGFEKNYGENVSQDTLLPLDRAISIPFNTIGANYEREVLDWNFGGVGWEFLSKWNNTSPRLRADITREDDNVAIMVGDNGPGLPRAVNDPEIIFSEDYSTSQGGYGLGMARNIIENYGGDLNYSEEAALQSDIPFIDRGFGLKIDLPVKK